MGKIRRAISEALVFVAGVWGGIHLTLSTQPLSADECYGWAAVFILPKGAYLIAILLAIGMSLLLRDFKKKSQE